MPNARVIHGATRLSQTIRVLREHWLLTEATWSDAVRKRFEDRYLAPIEPAVDSALNGLQTLAEVLDHVKRDCSDRSELA